MKTHSYQMSIEKLLNLTILAFVSKDWTTASATYKLVANIAIDVVSVDVSADLAVAYAA